LNSQLTIKKNSLKMFCFHLKSMTKKVALNSMVRFITMSLIKLNQLHYLRCKSQNLQNNTVLEIFLSYNKIMRYSCRRYLMKENEIFIEGALITEHKTMFFSYKSTP